MPTLQSTWTGKVFDPFWTAKTLLPTKTDVMNPDPANEETILEQALTFASTEARAAYLQGSCGDDAQLRARIESLIQAHEAAGGFLGDKPDRATPASSAMIEGTGSVIGRYKL